MMRFLPVLVVVLAFAPPLAAAHGPDPTPFTGLVTVAPLGATDVPVMSLAPRDTIAYSFSATENASTLAVQLVWTDADGASHVVPLASGAPQGEGKWDAPANIRDAALRFVQHAQGESTVAWSTLTSADFWTQPQLFLPAMLPIFMGIAAALVGWGANRWLKKRGRATRVLAPHEIAAMQETQLDLDVEPQARTQPARKNEPKEVKSYR
ncbi:MAG: hypothetical protein ACYDCK_14190 [Thermoplasmatota archaeon]